MHPLYLLYWVCLVMGGIYSLFTLLMGGLSHAGGHGTHVGHGVHLPHIHFNHAGTHHHAGHLPAGHAQNGAGQHAARAQVEPEESGGAASLLVFLNPTFVAGFLLGFGSLGLISRHLGLPPSTSLLYAGVGGLGFYGSAFWLVTKLFSGAGGTSHNRREDVIGLRAQVTAPIAGQLPGMVCYTVGGARQSLRAITDDEEPIPTGAVVRIRKIEKNTAHVMRIE